MKKRIFVSGHKAGTGLRCAGGLLVWVLALFMPSAWAAQFTQVVPESSEIHFQYQQMGVNMDGSFAEFSGELTFDPAQPEQGKAVLEVPVAAVDAGSDEADEELAGAEWFNTQAHPVARFESKSIQPTDSGYAVQGTLTIKGKSQEVTVPAQFTEKDGVGMFEGQFTILRGDFGVGEGAWSAYDIVANEIQIQFRIAAKP